MASASAENTKAAPDSSIAASASTLIPAAKAGVANQIKVCQNHEMFNDKIILS
ncbi:hypothetical protein [Methylomonas sp. HYX-M1]|uniref:hypothetical protein n=1 Tax=Methylomonas sp. HYX-M1 TaxID=3139307 RepID=UPI00345BF33D